MKPLPNAVVKCWRGLFPSRFILALCLWVHGAARLTHIIRGPFCLRPLQSVIRLIAVGLCIAQEALAGIVVTTPLTREEVPFSILEPTVQNGFSIFTPLQGRAFLQQVLGSPQKDLLCIQDLPDAIMVSVVDLSTGVCRVFNFPSAKGAFLQRPTVINASPYIAIVLENELLMCSVGAQQALFLHCPLPDTAVALDFLYAKNGHTYVVFLGSNGLYLGEIQAERLEWRLIMDELSFHQTWVGLVPRGKWFSSVADTTTLCFDFDGDGEDEIVLPDRDCVHVAKVDSSGGVQTERVPVPEGWFAESRLSYGQISYRQNCHIDLALSSTGPYKIVTLSTDSERSHPKWGLMQYDPKGAARDVGYISTSPFSSSKTCSCHKGR